MIESTCEGLSHELLSNLRSIEPPKSIDNVVSVDYMNRDYSAIVYLIAVSRKTVGDSNKIELEKYNRTCCFVPKIILDTYNNDDELEYKIKEHMMDILLNRITEDIGYAEQEIKNAQEEISNLNRIKKLFTKESE